MQIRRFAALVVLALLACGAEAIRSPRLHPRMPNIEVPIRRASHNVLAEDIPAAVAKAAEQVLARLNVTGMGVAVIHNHEVVFSGGFGFADAASKTPSTGTTLFQIASNSKAFTSMLAVMAHDKGILPLDEPVSMLAPAFKMNDTFASAIVTLRDMMSHRTGLPRHDQISFGATARSQFAEKLPYLALDKPTRYQPGEYNNIMFGLTGVAEEIAFGQQWETLAQEKIFDVLGMNMTFGNLSSARASPFAANLATAYVDRQEVPHLDADVIAPAGGVVSCANDMAKWLQLHLRQSAQVAYPTKPPPAGPMLVSAASYGLLLTGNTLYSGMYSPYSEYTLGWWRSPFYEDPSTGASQTLISHPGDLQGMASSVAFFPALGHGIAVLTNAGESSGRDAMMLEIADILLGVADPKVSWTDACVFAQQYAASQQSLLETRIQQLVQANMPPSLPLASYAGRFETYDDVYGSAEITYDKDLAALRICKAQFLYVDFAAPSTPLCGFVVPAWNETFALMDSTDRSAIGTHMIYVQYVEEAGRFFAPLEPMVKPIEFVRV